MGMIEFRVKVKADSSQQLTKMGLAVNIADCGDGEYWVVGPSESYLRDAVSACKLQVIESYQKIP